MTGSVVKMTGLQMRDSETGANGMRILADFDCEIFDGMLALRGCYFVKTATNGFTVWPPRGEPGLVRRSVQLKNPALINAMMTAARDTYRAMGGTKAEWTPQNRNEAA